MNKAELVGTSLAKGTTHVVVCPQCYSLLAESQGYPADVVNRAVMFLQAQSHQAAFAGQKHEPELVDIEERTCVPYALLYFAGALSSNLEEGQPFDVLSLLENRQRTINQQTPPSEYHFLYDSQ